MTDAPPPVELPAPTTLAGGLLRGFWYSPTLELVDEQEVCLNSEAIWLLNSARPGNGIPQLLSERLDEYWQSDGTAPHIVSIQFRRRTMVSELAFYVDAELDESYTPRSVSIRSGTQHHDLEEVRRFDLPSPKGWVRVPLGDPQGKGVNRYHRTWYIQLVVTHMHSNGRDMHIRCLKVLGPKKGGGGEQGNLLDLGVVDFAGFR